MTTAQFNQLLARIANLEGLLQFLIERPVGFLDSDKTALDAAANLAADRIIEAINKKKFSLW